MKSLTTADCQRVSGAGLKHDVMAYSAGIAGLTLIGAAAINGLTYCYNGDETTLMQAKAQAFVGVLIVGAVVLSEATGTSDLNGWYGFIQDVSYYKSFVWL